MKLEEINEIMACLPEGRTKFPYFKDRYALMLLTYILGQGKTVRELKQSKYRRLIQKPLVQDVIKGVGNGHLTADALAAVWPKAYHNYLLTLGTWGGRKDGARWYNQTSRPGWNLVLQLNFSGRHNQAYHRLVKPEDEDIFQCYGHPFAGGGRNTLAWARIDMDFESDEALIEEIQSDWVRKALRSYRYLAAYEKRTISNRDFLPWYVKLLGCNAGALREYIDNVLMPHMRIWDEAMLAAAVWFLKEEIGIGKIFFHTHDFGWKFKRIEGEKPPRSLYTKLPSRFCFEKTKVVPGFLMHKNSQIIKKMIRNKNPEFHWFCFEREQQRAILQSKTKALVDRLKKPTGL